MYSELISTVVILVINCHLVLTIVFMCTPCMIRISVTP